MEIYLHFIRMKYKAFLRIHLYLLAPTLIHECGGSPRREKIDDNSITDLV